MTYFSMKHSFSRATLEHARKQPGQVLFTVLQRTMGPRVAHDQEISMTGLTDDESRLVIDAVLRWLIHRDPKSCVALKDVVGKLRDI